jgi:hypothetical protein
MQTLKVLASCVHTKVVGVEHVLVDVLRNVNNGSTAQPDAIADSAAALSSLVELLDGEREWLHTIDVRRCRLVPMSVMVLYPLRAHNPRIDAYVEWVLTNMVGRNHVYYVFNTIQFDECASISGVDLPITLYMHECTLVLPYARAMQPMTTPPAPQVNVSRALSARIQRMLDSRTHAITHIGDVVREVCAHARTHRLFVINVQHLSGTDRRAVLAAIVRHLCTGRIRHSSAALTVDTGVPMLRADELCARLWLAAGPGTLDMHDYTLCVFADWLTTNGDRTNMYALSKCLRVTARSRVQILVLAHSPYGANGARRSWPRTC